MTADKKNSKIAIVGSGLVGSLAALYFAKNGHDVHVYEYREDIRQTELAIGRSINLALSHRGRRALAEVGLEKEVLETTIPMKGRMLHDLKGRTKIVLYDPCNNEVLYSVGRKFLNEVLLNAGKKYPNLKYSFKSKLLKVDLKEGAMKFQNQDNKENVFDESADLIIGCDGAFSAVRQQMVKTPGFNYSQEYIEHGYLELCIPAKDGQFQMPENYLHIWPRNIFMMIALPNQDRSFTVTLFMPFKYFDSIKTNGDLLEFFQKNFPDAIPLIGKERLIKDFFLTKPQHLVSIKCYPYNVGSKSIIIGDAAHAMVPFFGQGMNAGLEDCRILTTLLEENNGNIPRTLTEFTEKRWKDGHTICDLAMDNYIEMREKTKSTSFLIRKYFDSWLFRLFPNFWIPLYNSVSFTHIPYSQCRANRQWQDTMLKYLLIGILVLVAAFVYNMFI